MSQGGTQSGTKTRSTGEVIVRQVGPCMTFTGRFTNSVHRRAKNLEHPLRRGWAFGGNVLTNLDEIRLGGGGQKKPAHAAPRRRVARILGFSLSNSSNTLSPSSNFPALACANPTAIFLFTRFRAASRVRSRSSSNRRPSRTTSLADPYRPEATRLSTSRSKYGVREMFFVWRLGMYPLCLTVAHCGNAGLRLVRPSSHSKGRDA